MKSHVAEWSRLMWCARIVCSNGTTIRLAAHPYDIEMSGQTYLCDTGYSFSGIDSGVSLSAGAIDLKSFIGLSPEITLASISAGIFNGARVFVFVTDWANPIEDEEAVRKAIFGKTKINGNTYTIEALGLLDLWNTVVGDSHSSSCGLKFGKQGHGQCKVDLGALEATFTISGVLNNYQFDTDLTDIDDWFGAGDVWFTSGENLLMPRQRVKDYVQAGGTVITSEPFPYLPQAGDTGIIVPGCRKRLIDCKKYNNVRRRRGFDWIPGERFLRLVGGN